MTQELSSLLLPLLMPCKEVIEAAIFGSVLATNLFSRSAVASFPTRTAQYEPVITVDLCLTVHHQCR